MPKSDKGGGQAPDSSLYTTVSSARRSEAIVDQIRNLMRTNQLNPGDRLPNERDLCERIGVSRVTVREALRVLEAAGLIEIRVGARGGAFVTAPSSDRLGAELADLISLSPLTGLEVTEARQIVEVGIIPLVVARATEQDIKDLRTMTSEHMTALERGMYGMELSAAFHVRVAACAHNAAIEMLVHSFHGPMLMSLREAQVAAPLMGHRGTEEHRDFVEAIAAGDTALATKIMNAHLSRTARRISRVERGAGDGPDEGDEEPTAEATLLDA
jgi:DNA-binding FadR family transcriptional regulator